MAVAKGIVTLKFTDGTVRTWSDSLLLDGGCRIRVHEGNFTRANFDSRIVRSAEFTPDESATPTT